MDIIQNQPTDRSAFASLRRYVPQPVRWTFFDLLVVTLLTLVLTGVTILVARAFVSGTAAAGSLAVNLGAGGVVYILTWLAVVGGIVLRKRGTWREIGFRATSPWWFVLVFGLFILLYVVLIIASQVVQVVTGGFQNPQIAQLLDERGFSWINFIVTFTVGAIIAPIVEELTFRGLLYQWLRTHSGILVALAVSAALFAAVHFILPLFPVFFIIGVLLTLSFEWSQSLWVPIALHMMLNGSQIILLYTIQALGIQLPQ